jgi:phage shock protein A
LTEGLKLQAEVDRTADDLKKSYEATLRKIDRLKDKLNMLEQTASSDRDSERVSHGLALEAVSESLNRLSDALITNSKKAWQRYSRLESRCKAIDSEFARLDAVQVLCKKTEAIAADLLCYTLGHIKRETNRFAGS